MSIAEFAARFSISTKIHTYNATQFLWNRHFLFHFGERLGRIGSIQLQIAHVQKTTFYE